MNKSKSIFNGVIRSAALVLILVGISNCNQFHSFTGSESDAHLSMNPVFDNPSVSYMGPDQSDEGIATVGGSSDPQQPNVVVDTPNPLPPFQFCPDGKFQVLKRNGKYTQCRPCLSKGTKKVDGVDVPVCLVQRCDQTNQYIFFGDNVDRPSRSCERCDVLSADQTTCVVVVEPPVIAPPTPPTIDQPNPTPVVNCRTNPTLPRCRTTTGGDGGGDGGGDPLMIDSEGIQYASAADLVNSDESYFKSGDFNLTNPEPVTGVDSEDIAQRKNFAGFNLLGQQDQTVLDSGDFLHINAAGKNFKFKKMSWTRNDQRRYRFLALPDANGHIKGIDQLFGDNTFGPDANQPFATNGFNALMKWDRGDAVQKDQHFSDGYIDNNDAVFSKLRLWHDLNGDGNVDTAEEMRTELAPLSSFGITYIHLIPNEKFFETDQYGNDIAYKSVVGFKARDGKPKLGTAFDLWFQYNPRELSEAGKATIIKN